MATELARLETYVEGFLSNSHMTFNQVVQLRLCDSLKNVYLHFHKTYATKLGKVLTTGTFTQIFNFLSYWFPTYK